MRFMLFTALSVFCLTPRPDDAGKKDLEAMGGTWNLVAMEVEGKAVPNEKLVSARLTISGNTYTLVSNKKQHDVELKLDPSKSPKEIDMTFLDGPNTDRVGTGIYEINGEKLKICRSLDPQDERPKDFKTEGKTSYFVMTWERQP
jgi:uncharacterized protein (TIGR03067 family)